MTVDVLDMKPAEQDAFSLSEAAVLMDQARQAKDSRMLAAALNHNLEVWIAIKTFVSRDGHPMAKETRDNLIQLSRFVAEKTFRNGAAISAEALDTLININLQIAEGLLEGQKHSA